MSDTKFRNRHGHVAGLIVAIVTLAVAGFILLNRQWIVDQMSLWQYQPDAAISAIATRTTMTTEGQRYFYASHPVIENNQDFNKQCASQEQNTAILGCYTASRIYIYDVTDARLDGIREVTAAHEMLHAAYDRLSESEKQHINGLLEAEYSKLKDTKDFAVRMAFYARTEPGERDNELHSVIGTEVGNLQPELETYYRAYFSDRQQVVALHDKYASVFDSLQAKAQQLSTQLTTLADTITQQSAQYNQNVTQLNDAITSFNARASGGSFTTQAQFQAERAALVARADALDQQRVAINNNVADYDRLKTELTTVSSESEALNRSIDSRLAPAPSL